VDGERDDVRRPPSDYQLNGDEVQVQGCDRLAAG
jgi:hypothetical protein